MKTLSAKDVFIKALDNYGLLKDQNKYKVVCPFHGDDNPSMYINLDEAYFYCFGCGAKGSTYELIKLFNPSLSGLELAKKIGKIGKTSAIHLEHKEQEKLSPDEYIKQAKNFYYNLPETNWYKPDEEAIQIKRYMMHRGFKSTTLIKYGAKATYNTYYPIVFPLLENNKFTGYVLRTDDPEVEANRKYMYNRGFQRKLTLPGSYKPNKPIVVVEGYLDCLAGLQMGIKNIVALLGWKASQEQLEKIQQNKTKLIICALDNDEAGLRGYNYLKSVCNKYGFEVVRFRFPKGYKDFGDIIKNTKAMELIKPQIKYF